MSIAMQGLKLKPKYEDLINVAVSKRLYNTKTPNRDAHSFMKLFCFKTIRRRRDEGDGKTTRTSKQRTI